MYFEDEDMVATSQKGAPQKEKDFTARGPLVKIAPKPLASIWTRLGAFLIDCTILVFVGYLIGTLFTAPLALLGSGSRFVGFGIALLYFAVMDSDYFGGKTIGKGVMNIKLTHRSGKLITLPRSSIRSFLMVLPFFLYNPMLPQTPIAPTLHLLMTLIPLTLGVPMLYLLLFNSATRQGLHDLLADTFVVKRVAEGRLTKHVLMRDKGVAVALFITLSLWGIQRGVPEEKGGWTPVAEVETLIFNTGRVHSVSVHQGVNLTKQYHKTKRTGYVIAEVILKEKGDQEKMAREIVAILFNSSFDIDDIDRITVIEHYGYDLGLAKHFTHMTHNKTTEEWRTALRN